MKRAVFLFLCAVVIGSSGISYGQEKKKQDVDSITDEEWINNHYWERLMISGAFLDEYKKLTSDDKSALWYMFPRVKQSAQPRNLDWDIEAYSCIVPSGTEVYVVKYLSTYLDIEDEMKEHTPPTMVAPEIFDELQEYWMKNK